MIAAVALLGYAACAAWLAPTLLAPLTRRGLSVRAGLAAWLAAMASAVVSAVIGLQFALRTVAADWPRLTQDLCRSVARSACTPQVYGSALYQVGLAALTFLLTGAAAVALVRYGRRVQRSRTQTRAHAQAVLLVGADIPGAFAAGPGHARTVMLDDPRPAAYCAAGRPAAIVVTSGALAVLDRPQLRAVLAHERAHLAHGHHSLTAATRALAAAFPGVPLFTRGAAEVARLAEMSADDTAARSAGRPTVATALLALATGRAVPCQAGSAAAGPLPRTALAAAADAVPARVDRLLAPSRPGTARTVAILLAAMSGLLVAGPAVLTALAR
jgi:Zn-dependent protease with chaperone function